MKKLMLVLLAGLLIMPLAAGCSKKKDVDTGRSEIDMLRDAFLNDNVYFDFDRYNVRPDGATILQAKAAFMTQFSSLTTEVQGHCDERGTEAYNMALGDRRAKSAYNYMRSLGIDASRMTTVSYGFDRPLDPGHNESAWAKNRRAQFEITGGDPR